MSTKSRVTLLYEAQDGKCFLCGTAMPPFEDRSGPKALRATREHVYPRHGHKLRNNIVLAHARCNHEKGGRLPTAEEHARAAAIYAKLNLIAFLTQNSLQVYAPRLSEAERAGRMEAAVQSVKAFDKDGNLIATFKGRGIPRSRRKMLEALVETFALNGSQA